MDWLKLMALNFIGKGPFTGVRCCSLEIKSSKLWQDPRGKTAFHKGLCPCLTSPVTGFLYTADKYAESIPVVFFLKAWVTLKSLNISQHLLLVMLAINVAFPRATVHVKCRFKM